MRPAPMRDVVRVIRVKGARRGHLLACFLECGHWCTRRQRPGRFGVACAACSAVDELARQGLDQALPVREVVSKLQELGAWKQAAKQIGPVDEARSGRSNTPEDVIRLVTTLREWLVQHQKRVDDLERGLGEALGWAIPFKPELAESIGSHESQLMPMLVQLGDRRREDRIDALYRLLQEQPLTTATPQD